MVMMCWNGKKEGSVGEYALVRSSYHCKIAKGWLSLENYFCMAHIMTPAIHKIRVGLSAR